MSIAQGAAPSEDGRWVWVYGDSGVCAVDVSAWPAWTASQVVSPAGALSIDWRVKAFLPHPHIGDLAFFGGYRYSETTASSAPLGVWALQRRRRVQAGAWTWAWSSRMISGDDLENRSIFDLAWGAGDSLAGVTGPVKHLYTAGAGGWDLTVDAK
jgi:hypothetical protein